MQIQMLQEQPVQDPVMEQIAYLQKEWARIKYQVADEDSQISALEKLEKHAAKVSATYTNRAEPKIWEAIILATDAGINGGLGALSTVKKAKALLEAALKQNPAALDGSAHTSLGSLYYQVPGWPIGFGDDDKAEKHLKQALQTNPNGIDPNFFYADFLVEDGREAEAVTYFNRGLQAPDRPSRPLADAGRRQEIKAALAKINGKIKNKSKYN
jgi:Tfp pilus assembly protein PilF